MSDERKQSLKDNLAKTRLRLRTLAMRLSEEQWNATVYHDDVPWTALDLLRHLVDSEPGLVHNVERIRGGGGGVPEDFDQSRWNRSRVKRAANKGPEELLAELAESRTRALEVVDSVRDDEWELTGRAPWLEIVTVERFLNQIWMHEARHTDDIAEAVGLEKK